MQDKRIKVAMQCFLIHSPSSDFTVPCPLLDPKRYLRSVVLLASAGSWAAPDQYLMLCGPWFTFGIHVILTHTAGNH